MKKRSLLFALLIALIVPFAAQAQETVTIGDGTSTDYYTPIGTYYNYSITEQLYTADEIGMAGTISSISFDYAGTAAKDFPITVYMANVDAENLSTGISLADAEVVFEGTYSVTGEGWMTITLDTPFAYDGTSNLLIGINKDYVYWFSGNWNHTATEAVMARYSNNDDSAYTTTTVPASTRTSRPNIQMVITPGSGVTCEKPETLVAEDITSDGATLTWTGGSGNYNVEYKLASDAEWTSFVANTTATTCNLTGLTPGSAYQARVQSVCDDATSGWKSVNFTTSCGAITTFPWTETFESYASGDFIDPCWVNEHIEGTGTQLFKVSTSSNAGNATHQLQLPDMAGGTLTKLVLPEMTLPANYEFSLDIYRSNSTYNNNYPYEGIRVYASADGEIEGATELAFIPRQYTVGNDVIPAEATTGWYTYELPIGMSGTCYIILRGESQYCTATYMDNLTVKVMPTCPKPTGLAVTANSVTAHNATITWTENGEANTWIVEYSTSADFAEVLTETVEDTPTYTFAGLAPVTTYYVRVKAHCGDDDESEYSTSVHFTTPVACVAPTGFQIVQNSLKSTQVGLTWTSDATAWQLCINNDEENLVDIEEADVTINEGVVTYTLTDLTPETAYTVKVRNNCGSEDGFSAWTSTLNFTTLAECPVPANVTVTNIEHYTATVNWTGDSESYDVLVGHDEAAETYVDVDFEDQTIPATWINESQYAWSVVEGNGGYCMKSGNAGQGSTTSEISFTYTLTTNGMIEFDAECNGEGTSSYWDHCDFYIDGTRMLYAGANITGWNHYSFEVAEGEHTFKWSYTKDSSVDPSGDYFAVDNINLVKVNRIWNAPINVTTNECALTDLNPGSVYLVKIVPSCNEDAESEVVSFTTMSPNNKLFITEGNWNEASNWSPVGVPTIEQNVELRANVTITGEAEAASIAGTTGTNAYTLTIADGGKLKHLNSGVKATVKKTINPWTENGGYYLITNPTTSSYTPKADGTDGILAGNYDLYSWDYTQDDEWRNYKANAFSSLSSSSYNSVGYLYANEQGTELSITGTIKAANASLYQQCFAASSDNTYDFPGWFLLGNSFVCDAYLIDGTAAGNALPFIRMKADGTGFENMPAGTAINPLEGVFYEASSEEGGYSGYVYVSTTQPTAKNEGKLNVSLRHANKQLDNAILVFGGNQRMGKMSFRENSSKIYMPVEGKDYAIMSTESNIGEMPVSFKAENNGNYTLSFNAEEVSFAYLHLIDNMTGIETDLLANPSYNFEARTTDYANRFKLVFATGNADDDFAFFSNGNFVINNEGIATVQVIDVNGRIISSESINGCANVNVKAATGVYMIRLVNGDNVKVQKVVVK